jgi:hypothetical protein
VRVPCPDLKCLITLAMLSPDLNEVRVQRLTSVGNVNARPHKGSDTNLKNPTWVGMLNVNPIIVRVHPNVVRVHPRLAVTRNHPPNNTRNTPHALISVWYVLSPIIEAPLLTPKETMVYQAKSAAI